MRELSIEEKAQAYDDAIERAKDTIEVNQTIPDIMECVKSLFPELEESEDNRIRKELIRAFKSLNTIEVWNGINRSDILAWLEDQGNKDEEILILKDQIESLHAAIKAIKETHRIELEKQNILVNSSSKGLDKDSEDEKIRQFLIHEVVETSDKVMSYRNMNKKAVLAWLEKHDRQETDEWKEGNIISHGGTLALVIKGRRAMKSNGEFFTIQYPNEWAKAALNEIEHYFNELEKQGEQKLIDKIQLGKKYKCIASPRYSTFMTGKTYKPEDKFLCSLMNFCSDCFEPIEDDGQKPIDKVEPKFKVGDWLVHKEMVGVTCCITQIHAPHYYLTKNNSFIKFGEEDNYRPWTIQDAKDGDVLAYPDGSITLFKYMDENIYMALVLLVDGHIELNNSCAISNVHPATKEQRDTLFAGMKEAGYEWDAEKKELKKVEHKPAAWSEEDEHNLNSVINLVHNTRDGAWGSCVGERIESWLKSLKDRIQPKQEWSEEDEKMLKACTELVGSTICTNYGEEDGVTIESCRNWLKSLRPQNWTKEDKERYISCLQRLSTGNPEQPETINSKWFKEHVYPQSTWKPSDEQIKALSYYIENYVDNDGVFGRQLVKLYHDLLILRKE